MKIGITERGDASLDYSWVAPVENDKVDGVVLITKNLTDKFCQEVLRLHNMGKKIIVHATCTGWGKTVIEPNVPPYYDQIDNAVDLVEKGFPKDRIVLRVDPIIPTENGIKKVREVIDYAYHLKLLPDARVRISVLDEYKHVKERLKAAGYPTFYPGNEWQAPSKMMFSLIEALKRYDIPFYTCAESRLPEKNGQFIHAGCISKADLEILGLPVEEMDVNPQNRKGCMCLSCKTELLSCTHQCAHKCIYCYWRD